VDRSRVGFGEMVAAASGLALFIVMFLPWYRKDIGIGPENLSAWAAFDLIDLLLLLAAAVAIGMAVARAARAIPPNLPASPGTIVAGAGALAALLLLYRLVELPGADGEGVEVGRKIGVYLGLIASLGIAFGGFTAINERARRRSRR
jgi:hypothetical protein